MYANPTLGSFAGDMGFRPSPQITILQLYLLGSIWTYTDKIAIYKFLFLNFDDFQNDDEIMFSGLDADFDDSYPGNDSSSFWDMLELVCGQALTHWCTHIPYHSYLNAVY